MSTKLKQLQDAQSTNLFDGLRRRVATRILKEHETAKQTSDTALGLLTDAAERGDVSMGILAMKAVDKSEDTLAHAEERANAVLALDNAETDKRLRVVVRMLSKEREGRIGGVRVMAAVNRAYQWALRKDKQALEADESLADKPSEQWTTHPKEMVAHVLQSLS